MKALIIYIVLVTFYSSCNNKPDPIIHIGLNQLTYDKLLTTKVYKGVIPPPPVNENIGTFNICIDRQNNFYYYSFAPKVLCGMMLEDIENPEPFLYELQNLPVTDFHKVDLASLKEKLKAIDARQNHICIGLPTDTVNTAELKELIDFIHSTIRINWKVRRLNELETALLKKWPTAKKDPADTKHR